MVGRETDHDAWGSRLDLSREKYYVCLIIMFVLESSVFKYLFVYRDRECLRNMKVAYVQQWTDNGGR